MSGEPADKMGEFDELDEFEGFEEVTADETPASQRRAPKGGTAQPTGPFVMNTNGSNEVRDLIREQGLDPETVMALYRANPKTRVVAMFLVEPNTPNAKAFRLNSDQRTYTLYLHSVYEQYPSLRPVTKMKVSVSRGVVKGRPCLFINLNGLATRTTHREG